MKSEIGLNSEEKQSPGIDQYTSPYSSQLLKHIKVSSTAQVIKRSISQGYMSSCLGPEVY